MMADTAELENDIAELMLGCPDLEVQRDMALERVAELEAALRTARRQLVTLGGDEGADDIHRSVLDVIDGALSN